MLFSNRQSYSCHLDAEPSYDPLHKFFSWTELLSDLTVSYASGPKKPAVCRQCVSCVTGKLCGAERQGSCRRSSNLYVVRAAWCTVKVEDAVLSDKAKAAFHFLMAHNLAYSMRLRTERAHRRGIPEGPQYSDIRSSDEDAWRRSNFASRTLSTHFPL